MATRIYLVKSADGAQKHLVRASNPAQAMRHVTNTLYTVTVADTDEAYDAARAGIKIETAGE